MEYVSLTPTQANDILVMLGEDVPDSEDRFGLITVATEDGRLRVRIARIGPHGPECFWTGLEWAAL